MMGDLRTELHKNGFLMVLGTAEMSAVHQYTDNNLNLVGKGKPNHWDNNNGTLVVYDQCGYPWLRSSKFFGTDGIPWADEPLIREHGLTRGAYVPHSNDGGTWKRFLLEQTGVEV